MEPFHGSLADEDGQSIAEVDGTIESSEEAPGICSGRFELQDTPSFIQGVMDKKTFRLQVDDRGTLMIKVDSISTGPKSGYSEAEFSTV